MPAVFDRCVEHVKAQGKAKNPFAVCRASMGSDAEIAKRAGTGKRKRSRKRRRK